MRTPAAFARWSEAWIRPRFRVRFFVTIPFFLVVLFSLANYLQWVERRLGIVIPDPVLAAFPPTDLTWLIFSLIYLSIIIALIVYTREPDRLLLAFQSYSIMVVFRIIAMYLLPLDPPAVTIPLQDPFVQLFGSGNVLMKDLFFSGHTSTLFLLFLTAGSKRLKVFFLLCTIAVATSIIIHHTHYTVDVFVAPFVAYCSYRIALLMNKRYDPSLTAF